MIVVTAVSRAGTRSGSIGVIERREKKTPCVPTGGNARRGNEAGQGCGLSGGGGGDFGSSLRKAILTELARRLKCSRRVSTDFGVFSMGSSR